MNYLRLIVVTSIFVTGLDAAVPEFSSADQVIDFRISYPLVNLKSGVSVRQKNYLGMDLHYQYFFWKRIGPVLNLGGWMLPLHVGTQNVRMGFLSSMLGLGFRAFPDTYLDPTLYVLGGGGWAATGHNLDSRFFSQVGARASLNLYSQRDPFQDSALALALSGSSFYVFQPLDQMHPLYFDIGLSLRGGF